MSHREYVAFLATTSITIAMAIDVMLPALSDMRSALGLAETSNSIALTVTLYFVGMSSAQLFYGPLADHFGRKPILYVGLSIYLIGAIGSTVARSLSILLISRFVWGIGAASLRVLSNTLARDVYEGGRMARVLSLVMTVFLLGPVVAPLIGEGLLRVGGWRTVFGAGIASALILFVWSFRLDETLDPAHRLPLGFARTASAIRAVLSSHQTRWYSLAQVFVYGNLLMYLASTELLFDVVYDRADMFAVAFSATGIVSAFVAFVNSSIVERVGPERMLLGSAIASTAFGGTLAGLAVVSDGAPPFWVWLVFIGLVSVSMSVLIPTSNALAMQPMGHLAGTAAAVVGTFAMGGGSILGAIVDRTQSGSVTPQAVGFFLFSAAALTCVRIAGSRRVPASTGGQPG